MKPLFIKKNGTVSKVSGIIMNLIPSYTMAEYNALTHKPLLWVRTDEEYAQIPSEDVSYGSGSVKDALDGLEGSKKWKFILNTALSTTSTTYNFPSSIADCNEVIIAGCWMNGSNSVWVHVPIFGGVISVSATYLMLNNSPTNTHYAKVTGMTTTSITAEATDTNTWIRVYVR